MNRRQAILALVVIAAAPAVAPAQSLDTLKSAISDPLVAMLQQQLGITADQAKGGMGSLLTLAREHLAAGDFDRITEYIPGTEKYLATAKQLGAVDGPLRNLEGLNGAFGKLGIKPEAAAQFVPTVTEFVGKAGGEEARALLAGALQ